MDYDFFEVGERIAMYRKARGYSQREFAEMGPFSTLPASLLRERHRRTSQVLTFLGVRAF